MKIKLKVEKEFDIKTLHVKAGARYWEDATVNGVEDTEGVLIPCRVGDYWCPIIDIDTGQILNWEQGKTADIHYKVCDNGSYRLQDVEGITLLVEEGYVPSCMSPNGGGYGDYIVMKINENSFIENWWFDIRDFVNDND